MKLRGKTAIILLGATAIFFVVVYLWSRFVLLGGFAQTEEDEVRRGLDQVLDSMKGQLQALSTRTADWAYWDESYQFVEDRNQDYIDKNTGYDQFASFSSLVNFILFFNRRGELVFTKGFDLKTQEEIPAPPGLLGRLAQDSPFLNHSDEKSKAEGLLLTDEGPLLVASRPILTSDMKGPIRGTLVFAGLLNQERVHDIAAKLRTSLELRRLDEPGLPSPFQQAHELLASGATAVVRPLDKARIAGYTFLRDVAGQPILLLRLDAPRQVYDRGLRTLQYFGIGVIVTGVLQGLIMLFMLRSTVLSPLMRLTAGLRAIEATADPAQRVPVQTRDEVGELAESINRTLASLEAAQNAVHFSEARLRAVVENAVDGIITMDERGCIQSVNKAAERIFGYEADELLGREVTVLMPEPYRGQHHEFLDAYLREGEQKLIGMGRDFLAVKKDGSIFPVYLAVSEVRLGEQRLFTGILRDITERKRYEEFLAHAAAHDALTGLMNRRSLEEELEVALNAAKRYGHAFSLCMGDIDNFKQVNDRYGHALGDAVLKRAGEIIHKEIRKEDFGARFGGDEFCIVFTHTPSVDAIKCMERIRHALSSHVFCPETGHPFLVTGSFGIADLTTREMDAKALLAAADQALYQAKNEGRNRIVMQTR